MHYEYRNGCYVLMDGGKAIAPPTKEIALLYSESSHLPGSVLHKHGSVENVMRHHDRMTGAFERAGFIDMARELKVFRSAHLPVEELNRCLGICDYVGRMVQDQERTIEGQLASPEDEGPSP